jgi:mRNA interferase YafQ
MKISQTKQFKKDVKRARRRGKNLQKLQDVIRLLLTDQPLPEKHRDHPLGGVWVGRRDCHIEPDWLLIYKLLDDELRLERTGTHSDLF